MSESNDQEILDKSNIFFLEDKSSFTEFMMNEVNKNNDISALNITIDDKLNNFEKFKVKSNKLPSIFTVKINELVEQHGGNNRIMGLKEYKKKGYTATMLRYQPDLKATAQELIEAGFTEAELIEAGFTDKEEPAAVAVAAAVADAKKAAEAAEAKKAAEAERKNLLADAEAKKAAASVAAEEKQLRDKVVFNKRSDQIQNAMARLKEKTALVREKATKNTPDLAAYFGKFVEGAKSTLNRGLNRLGGTDASNIKPYCYDYHEENKNCNMLRESHNTIVDSHNLNLHLPGILNPKMIPNKDNPWDHYPVIGHVDNNPLAFKVITLNSGTSGINNSPFEFWNDTLLNDPKFVEWSDAVENFLSKDHTVEEILTQIVSRFNEKYPAVTELNNLIKGILSKYTIEDGNSPDIVLPDKFNKINLKNSDLSTYDVFAPTKMHERVKSIKNSIELYINGNMYDDDDDDFDVNVNTLYIDSDDANLLKLDTDIEFLISKLSEKYKSKMIVRNKLNDENTYIGDDNIYITLGDEENPTQYLKKDQTLSDDELKNLYITQVNLQMLFDLLLVSMMPEGLNLDQLSEIQPALSNDAKLIKIVLLLAQEKPDFMMLQETDATQLKEKLKDSGYDYELVDESGKDCNILYNKVKYNISSSDSDVTNNPRFLSKTFEIIGEKGANLIQVISIHCKSSGSDIIENLNDAITTSKDIYTIIGIDTNLKSDKISDFKEILVKKITYDKVFNISNIDNTTVKLTEAINSLDIGKIETELLNASSYVKDAISMPAYMMARTLFDFLEEYNKVKDDSDLRYNAIKKKFTTVSEIIKQSQKNDDPYKYWDAATKLIQSKMSGGSAKWANSQQKSVLMMTSSSPQSIFKNNYHITVNKARTFIQGQQSKGLNSTILKEIIDGEISDNNTTYDKITKDFIFAIDTNSSDSTVYQYRGTTAEADKQSTTSASAAATDADAAVAMEKTVKEAEELAEAAEAALKKAEAARKKAEEALVGEAANTTLEAAEAAAAAAEAAKEKAEAEEAASKAKEASNKVEAMALKAQEKAMERDEDEYSVIVSSGLSATMANMNAKAAAAKASSSAAKAATAARAALRAAEEAARKKRAEEAAAAKEKAAAQLVVSSVFIQDQKEAAAAEAAAKAELAAAAEATAAAKKAADAAEAAIKKVSAADTETQDAAAVVAKSVRDYAETAKQSAAAAAAAAAAAEQHGGSYSDLIFPQSGGNSNNSSLLEFLL